MTLKVLLALALIGAAQAGDYEYSSNEKYISSTAPATAVNQLEQQTYSSSGEDYLGDYSGDSSANSQATPDGYDYKPARPRQFIPSTSDQSATTLLLQATKAASAATAVSASTLLPAPLPVVRQREREFYPPASYDFSYAVHDESTGDIKEHSESRDGYVVRGSYSLVDPDGYKRTVTYTADDVHGFNAVVNRVPYVPLKRVALAPLALDERTASRLRSAGVSIEAEQQQQPSGTVGGDSYASAPGGRDVADGPYA